MFDFEQIGLLVKLAALLLAVIALAAMVYTVRSVLGPVIPVVQWLFAYTPGERPNDVTAGVVFGMRMLAWSLIIGVVVFVVATSR